MPTSPKIVVVSSQFYKLSQSLHYDKIVIVSGLKMRVKIERNAYDDQSHIIGYVLDPVHYRWNALVHRPINQSGCKDANYASDNWQRFADLFRSESDSVIKELIAITHS